MKIKPLVNNFKTPIYATIGSAAFDIHAVDEINLQPNIEQTISLGFSAEVPPDHVAVLAPRSSIGCKGLVLCNTIGVIDCDYRGEWKVIIKSNVIMNIIKSERFIQCLILPVKQVNFNIVSDISKTGRGEGGFGSTGS